MKRKHSRMVAATSTACIVLILSGVLCFMLESYILSRSNEVATQAANQMARHLNQHLIECLSATYALAALVRSNNGDTAGFESLAEEYLAFEHGLSALQLAPKGVVRHIVPLRGNEKAIGHDLFADPKRSAEANKALQTKQLTLAGPLDLVQGGEAIIGRLPVFLGDNRQEFWGFTIALIKRIIHPDDVEIFKAHRHDVREMNVIEEVEFRIIRPDGTIVWLAHTCQPVCDEQGAFAGTRGSNKDITSRKQAEEERERLIGELQQALAQVKQLSGFLPICASCKKIRDDNGYWTQIEAYIRDHSQAEFSHGICPECMKKLYPEYCGLEPS